MSLPFDHPHLETGDVNGALSDWEVDGFGLNNNDHGRVYIRKLAGNVEASKTRLFAAPDLVASGPDVPADATLVLTPQNNSGLTIRARRASGEIGPAALTPPANPLTVWLFFANEADLRRKDNQLGSMLLRGEVDFLEPMRDTMREFLLRMSAIYPPPPTVGFPNDFVPSPIEAGRQGMPEWYAQFFWSLSALGTFEITGLQNPGDYRLWFVNQCLATIYARKVRGEDDPMFARQLAFQDEADRLFTLTRPWVDVDRDQVADRQPKIRNVRLSRG